MSLVDPAVYYGLPAPVAATQPTAAPASPEQPAAAVVRRGLSQDPVLVLVGLLFLAFLLARAAEHGLSLGFKITAR